MYRCSLTAIAACLVTASAMAQVARNFPADALRGTLVVVNPPEALLNGQPARLGAGARILGTDNLIKVPATLIDQRLAVHYTVDTQGLLRQVWILRPEEAANKPWPERASDAQRWSFDPVAQTWSKP
jgi:hypothetical protein